MDTDGKSKSGEQDITPDIEEWGSTGNSDDIQRGRKDALDGSSEESQLFDEERIDEIDKLIENPALRASRLWKILYESGERITTWDLICFSVEVLGKMSEVYTWLHSAALRVCKLVYKAHYLNHEILMKSDTQIRRNLSEDTNQK